MQWRRKEKREKRGKRGNRSWAHTRIRQNVERETLGKCFFSSNRRHLGLKNEWCVCVSRMYVGMERRRREVRMNRFSSNLLPHMAILAHVLAKEEFQRRCHVIVAVVELLGFMRRMASSSRTFICGEWKLN